MFRTVYYEHRSSPGILQGRLRITYTMGKRILAYRKSWVADGYPTQI